MKAYQQHAISIRYIYGTTNLLSNFRPDRGSPFYDIKVVGDLQQENHLKLQTREYEWQAVYFSLVFDLYGGTQF